MHETSDTVTGFSETIYPLRVPNGDTKVPVVTSQADLDEFCVKGTTPLYI